ncbi:alanine racemase [Kribbella shirazensis]|uniref:Alanine racemase n=1 Tax=Kribbella shirazensis TaxID=1105143 RepID=A0A7X5V4X4_9ACTN|nr:alanine racemase [Kribbella shirazensis]NIK54688.1 alanine racemase [Kribbella shirazensis]
MYLVQSRPRPVPGGITGLSEAVVDLSAVRDNVRTFRRRVAQDVMAVVKADAFGHGAVPVARAAVEAGATWLGVAHAAEALQLRAAGLRAPILAWLYDPAELMLLSDIDVSVSTVAELQRVARTPSVHSAGFWVHLKLDTGLHRAGSAPDQWIELTRTAAHYEALGAVTVRGIWSHLSHGDSADAMQSTRQLQLLRTGVGLAHRAGLRPSVVHLANSAGAVTLDAQDTDLVRIGAGLYGIDELGIGLRPAMRLVSKVTQVRRIRAGEGVSYGHDFVAERDTTVALVPIGYADGVPRVAVRRASVLCRGVRMPVIGRIAMDQFVVDARDLAVEPGEPVTLFGDGSAGEPTAQDWADWAGTIPHEIYCGIGSRVPRRYEEK